MGEGGVFLNAGDDVASDVGVAARKLVCKGGKDVSEFCSVEVISGTEEAGTEESIFGDHV